MLIMSAIDDLAAALNDHQVTDDDGQVSSESAPEQVDSLESQSDVEETEEETPKAPTPEPEEAEDEQGRKYIPEKRFKQVYGEKKELERELEALKGSLKETKKGKVDPLLERTNALEMEIVYERYPEFKIGDPKYSEELDRLAGELIKANPSLSPLQAAREAKEFANRIGSKLGGIKSESVQVKREVSDTGIAGRSQKSSTEPDIDITSASADDLERYLKQTGNW